MSEASPQVLDLPDGEVIFYSTFFSQPMADLYFRQLRDTTTWRQESIKLYGKSILMPRLTAWYGDEGTSYTYSGLLNTPLPWTPALLEVKQAVEIPCGVTFNSVLLNCYRSGKDSIAWHSDDEKEFGENPVIASVNFGQTRTFQLKHKQRTECRVSIELTHGSLLIMRGATQHHWLHQIPKTRKAVAERINLTFRVIQNGRE